MFVVHFKATELFSMKSCIVIFWPTEKRFYAGETFPISKSFVCLLADLFVSPLPPYFNSNQRLKLGLVEQSYNPAT